MIKPVWSHNSQYSCCLLCRLLSVVVVRRSAVHTRKVCDCDTHWREWSIYLTVNWSVKRRAHTSGWRWHVCWYLVDIFDDIIWRIWTSGRFIRWYCKPFVDLFDGYLENKWLWRSSESVEVTTSVTVVDSWLRECAVCLDGLHGKQGRRSYNYVFDVRSTGRWYSSFGRWRLARRTTLYMFCGNYVCLCWDSCVVPAWLRRQDGSQQVDTNKNIIKK